MNSDPQKTLVSDPVMADLVARYEPPAFGGAPLFEALVRAVISQQLSKAAAATIFKRLAALTEIAPAPLLLLSPDEFRACGLSRPKAGYIHAIARAALDGALKGVENLADDEALARLVRLQGVGRWTAEVILIFALGRDDIWAVDDAGLRRAARRLYGAESAAEFVALGERFAPWRSHAAWYLWCSLESK